MLDNYIAFMEETGAQYIGIVLQWIYFKKRSELGSFDIFSNLENERRI